MRLHVAYLFRKEIAAHLQSKYLCYERVLNFNYNRQAIVSNSCKVVFTTLYVLAIESPSQRKPAK
jgi:hypothetical protein